MGPRRYRIRIRALGRGGVGRDVVDSRATASSGNRDCARRGHAPLVLFHPALGTRPGPALSTLAVPSCAEPVTRLLSPWRESWRGSRLCCATSSCPYASRRPVDRRQARLAVGVSRRVPSRRSDCISGAVDAFVFIDRSLPSRTRRTTRSPRSPQGSGVPGAPYWSLTTRLQVAMGLALRIRACGLAALVRSPTGRRGVVRGGAASGARGADRRHDGDGAPSQRPGNLPGGSPRFVAGCFVSRPS